MHSLKAHNLGQPQNLYFHPPLNLRVRTPNCGLIKAAGTEEYRGPSHRASWPRAPAPGGFCSSCSWGAQPPQGLLGFWAFPGSHGVLRAKGYYALCRGRIRSLWGEQGGDRENRSATGRSTKPTRQTGSPGRRGRARTDGKCVKNGTPPLPREKDTAYNLARS